MLLVSGCHCIVIGGILVESALVIAVIAVVALVQQPNQPHLKLNPTSLFSPPSHPMLVHFLFVCLLASCPPQAVAQCFVSCVIQSLFIL